MSSAPASQGRRAPGTGASLFLIAILCLAIVAIDQAVKAWARVALASGGVQEIIPGVLGLSMVRNGGAAFGVLPGNAPLFVACALAVMLILLWLVLTSEDRSWLQVAAVGMVCGGAVGNAIDRVLLDGKVTDLFVTLFMDFPVFNVADVAITCGCVLLIIALVVSWRHEDADEAAGEA